jgi:hypothetical protein
VSNRFFATFLVISQLSESVWTISVCVIVILPIRHIAVELMVRQIPVSSKESAAALVEYQLGRQDRKITGDSPDTCASAVSSPMYNGFVVITSTESD